MPIHQSMFRVYILPVMIVPPKHRLEPPRQFLRSRSPLPRLVSIAQPTMHLRQQPETVNPITLRHSVPLIAWRRLDVKSRAREQSIWTLPRINISPGRRNARQLFLQPTLIPRRAKNLPRRQDKGQRTQVAQRIHIHLPMLEQPDPFAGLITPVRRLTRALLRRIRIDILGEP